MRIYPNRPSETAFVPQLSRQNHIVVLFAAIEPADNLSEPHSKLFSTDKMGPPTVGHSEVNNKHSQYTFRWLPALLFP